MTKLCTFSPRTDLCDTVHNFILGSYPCAENYIPILPFAMLVIFLKGGVSEINADGGSTPLPRSYLVGPSLTPRIYICEPDTKIIVCSFRPGLFNQFFDIPLNKTGKGPTSLVDFLPHTDVERLHADFENLSSDEEAIGVLENFLCRAQRSRGIIRKLLPTNSFEQFLLPLEELASIAALSSRQFERRFLSNFGMPLREFRRLVRFFSGVLPLLLSPAPRKGVMTRIAMDGGYFDQAHLSRDFREFMGESHRNFIKNKRVNSPTYQLWESMRKITNPVNIF
jgi:AraC-like DNA-binding protein